MVWAEFISGQGVTLDLKLLLSERLGETHHMHFEVRRNHKTTLLVVCLLNDTFWQDEALFVWANHLHSVVLLVCRLHLT